MPFARTFVFARRLSLAALIESALVFGAVYSSVARTAVSVLRGCWSPLRRSGMKGVLVLLVVVASLTVVGVALGDAADAQTPSVEGAPYYKAWSIGQMYPWTNGYYFQMYLYLINNAGSTLDSIEWNEDNTSYYYGNETGCAGAIVRSYEATYGDDCQCWYYDTSGRNFGCSY